MRWTERTKQNLIVLGLSWTFRGVKAVERAADFGRRDLVEIYSELVLDRSNVFFEGFLELVIPLRRGRSRDHAYDRVTTARKKVGLPEKPQTFYTTT